MKVFVTCGKHPLKSSGGYATYTHALCKNLKSMGFDVNIIAISDENSVEDSEIGRIFSVTSSYLPTRSSTFITGLSFLWSRSFTKILQEQIKKDDEKCIVYGIGPWALAGLSLRKKFREKVRLVNVFFTSVAHETQWLMKGINVTDYGIVLKIKYTIIHFFSLLVLQRLELKILKNCDIVLVHNEFPRQLLINDFGINSNKIMKLPYYVETYGKVSLYKKYDVEIKSEKNDEEKNEKNMICVSVCRQEPRKGINYFLRAMKLIKNTNLPIRAKIVGSGDLLKNHIRISKKLGVDDIVEFTGFVPDIKKILEEADVFVQPSLQESSGSVSVLEALQSGTPVIATDCDALPEDIEDGTTGLLVPRRDEKALADAITRLYNDKDLVIKMGHNAKKSILEKFTKEKMEVGLASLHKKLWSH